MKIVDEVRVILEPFLLESGYELWFCEFVKAGAEYNLNVYIDKEGGISTDDCEKVSRYLEAALDERDLISQNYYLIVSSPGLDRPLLTDAHFERYAGQPVDVALYKGFDGRKKFAGELIGRNEEALAILVDGEAVRIPRELVSKVRLQVVF
ncbi:MAG: ribosome maturation factor RimP [Clostridiales Family XIII bacterium]|jgi:ribosome maturation factor RimP|nr:ribosome maturation factor RimP [Clostridiales Family XIII bacterium]